MSNGYCFKNNSDNSVKHLTKKNKTTGDWNNCNQSNRLCVKQL